MNKAEHTEMTIYIPACKLPLLLILSLSPEEKAFMQFDKLNPAKGIIAPDIRLPKEAKNINIFLCLNKVKTLLL